MRDRLASKMSQFLSIIQKANLSEEETVEVLKVVTAFTQMMGDAQAAFHLNPNQTKLLAEMIASILDDSAKAAQAKPKGGIEALFKKFLEEEECDCKKELFDDEAIVIKVGGPNPQLIKSITVNGTSLSKEDYYSKKFQQIAKESGLLDEFAARGSVVDLPSRGRSN